VSLLHDFVRDIPAAEIENFVLRKIMSDDKLVRERIFWPERDPKPPDLKLVDKPGKIAMCGRSMS
jgi:hypothetical protein